jgi:hypothetical protein
VSVAVVVLVALALVPAALAWRVWGGSQVQLALVLAMTAALTVAGVLVLVAGPPVWGDGVSRLLLVLLAGLAVVGGGPLSVFVLGWADRESAPTPPGAARTEPLDDGEVLRGGAWIGSLERAGIFATLAAGWPEGVAIVLAVKGVGRYHELGAAGAAERFIIGTFASVLWASACAALWWFG